MGKINSRTKGHAYERLLVKEFKGFGFDTKTSRYANRELDDLKVDLVNTGFFNVQAKAVERLGSYHDILASMPQDDNNYNTIFHKRNRKGEVVVMTKEDFYDIMQMLISTGVINVK
jgi:uncharacterized short protein YbdD (DUF466 family)